MGNPIDLNNPALRAEVRAYLEPTDICVAAESNAPALADGYLTQAEIEAFWGSLSNFQSQLADTFHLFADFASGRLIPSDPPLEHHLAFAPGGLFLPAGKIIIDGTSASPTMAPPAAVGQTSLVAGAAAMTGALSLLSLPVMELQGMIATADDQNIWQAASVEKKLNGLGVDVENYRQAWKDDGLPFINEVLDAVFLVEQRYKAEGTEKSMNWLKKELNAFLQKKAWAPVVLAARWSALVIPELAPEIENTVDRFRWVPGDSVQPCDSPPFDASSPEKTPDDRTAVRHRVQQIFEDGVMILGGEEAVSEMAAHAEKMKKISKLGFNARQAREAGNHATASALEQQAQELFTPPDGGTNSIFSPTASTDGEIRSSPAFPSIQQPDGSSSDEAKLNIGLRIKSLRMEKGIPQTKLAELVGVRQNYISMIESGRSHASPGLRWKLEKALDLPEGELGGVEGLKRKRARKALPETEPRIGPMTLGENIRYLRVKRGMSQTDLAEAIGSHRVYIGQIETGLSNPSPALRWKLEKALDLPEGILGGVESSRKQGPRKALPKTEPGIGPMTLGENIRYLRVNKGMTQRNLAKVVGTHQPVIGNIENDWYNPSPDLRWKLEEALGLPEGVLGGIEGVSRRGNPNSQTAKIKEWTEGTVAGRIHHARKAAGFTRGMLAQKAGVRTRDILMFELAGAEVQPEVLRKIEIALGLSEGELDIIGN